MEKNFENTNSNRNRYIAIYPCTKFQVIQRIDFRNKFT